MHGVQEAAGGAGGEGRGGVRELSAAARGAVSEDAAQGERFGGAVREAVDAVSAVSGQYALRGDL